MNASWRPNSAQADWLPPSRIVLGLADWGFYNASVFSFHGELQTGNLGNHRGLAGPVPEEQPCTSGYRHGATTFRQPGHHLRANFGKGW